MFMLAIPRTHLGILWAVAWVVLTASSGCGQAVDGVAGPSLGGKAGAGGAAQSGGGSTSSGGLGGTTGGSGGTSASGGTTSGGTGGVGAGGASGGAGGTGAGGGIGGTSAGGGGTGGAPGALPSCSATFSNVTPSCGATVNANWSCTNATTCSYSCSGDTTSSGVIPCSGSSPFQVTKGVKCTLTGKNGNGLATSSASVTCDGTPACSVIVAVPGPPSKCPVSGTASWSCINATSCSYDCSGDVSGSGSVACAGSMPIAFKTGASCTLTGTSDGGVTTVAASATCP